MECTEGRPSNHFALGCSLWARQILQHYMIQRERERDWGSKLIPLPGNFGQKYIIFLPISIQFQLWNINCWTLEREKPGLPFPSKKYSGTAPHIPISYVHIQVWIHTSNPNTMRTHKSGSAPLIPIPCVYTSLNPHLSSLTRIQVWICIYHPCTCIRKHKLTCNTSGRATHYC